MSKLMANDIIQQQERKKKRKIKQYNAVLNKCYERIKFIAKKDEKFCFYLVPHYIIGIPLYDMNSCIVYIIQCLSDGGFNVNYTHPNLLYISWDKPKKRVNLNNNVRPIKYFDNKNITYKPVSDYKPSGKFVYDSKKLDKLDKKMEFLFRD